MSESHPNKKCPRCGKQIACRPVAVSSCPCTEVQLATATRAYLAKTKYDCLCNACLQELDQLATRAARDTFPPPGAPLTEGLHYYLEHGRWVFTEYYHILRGSCCRSGCRHCAYGYDPKAE